MPSAKRPARPLPASKKGGETHPLAWWNGRIVRLSSIFLPLDDRMVGRGYGAFESLRTYSGKPFRLEEHLLRLAQSCALLRLVLPYTHQELIKAVQDTVQRNTFPESLIKLYVTGGRSHSLLPEAPPSMIVMCLPLPTFPARFYREGIALRTTPLTRTLPLAKSTNYLAAVVASVEAHADGFDEIVFTNRAGALLEGSTFNVFAVVEGTLVTPQRDVLAGITARDILAMAEEHHIPVRRKAIRRQDISRASELFISSSNRELIPVQRVDTLVLPHCPGPVTRALHRTYRLIAQRQSCWLPHEGVPPPAA